MKALVVPELSAKKIAQLEWQDVSKPEPKADEVLIKTVAVGLNPVDYKIIEDRVAAWSFPHTVGLDVAGTIEAVGVNVSKFKVGDRVAGHCDLAKNGTFAEFVLANPLALAKIPDTVSFETAAGSICAGLTAYQALFRKDHLSDEVETIFVSAGAGGVGSMAIQLSKNAGYKVFTTFSTPKVAFAKELGADEVIDYRTENTDARLKELTTGLGVDVIIDTVNDATADVQRLAYNGQLVCVLDLPEKLANTNKALTISDLDLGGAHRSGNPKQVADLGRMMSELLELITTGKVDPHITRVLKPEEIPAGLEDLKNGKVQGKLVARF